MPPPGPEMSNQKARADFHDFIMISKSNVGI